MGYLQRLQEKTENVMERKGQKMYKYERNRSSDMDKVGEEMLMMETEPEFIFFIWKKFLCICTIV